MEMSSSYFKSKTELFILFFIALKKLEASQYQRIFFRATFVFLGGRAVSGGGHLTVQRWVCGRVIKFIVEL